MADHDHHRGLSSCTTCIAALKRHVAEGCDYRAMHLRDLAALEHTDQQQHEQDDE